MGTNSVQHKQDNMKYLAVILFVAAVHAAPEAEADADALYGYYGYGARAYGLGYGYGYAGYPYAHHGYYYGKRSADAEADAQVLLNGNIGYGVYGATAAIAAPAVAAYHAAPVAVATAPVVQHVGYNVH